VRQATPFVSGGSSIVGTVSTDLAGAFVYRLPPGASRTITLIDRVPSGAAVAVVRQRVRASATLHPDRRRLHNGQIVILRGRLRGPVPVGGVFVNMQARRGHRWQGFGDPVHTTARGTYRIAYRFTRTFHTTRYRLRVHIPAQGGYPYATGWSPAITVRVRR
jgi:hypothetical protein